MSSGAASDLFQALHPARLPETFARLSWTDVVSAFGFGLLLAALILTLLQPVLRRRLRPVGWRRQMRAAVDLPRDERLLVLRQLMQQRGLPLTAELRAALYRGDLQPEALEAVLRHPRRAAAAAKRAAARQGAPSC